MHFIRRATVMELGLPTLGVAEDNPVWALNGSLFHGPCTASNILPKLALLSLIITTPALAEESHIDLPSLGASQGPQLRQVNGTMTHQEYRSAVRHNQRMIRRLTRDYVEDRLASMGMSERAVSLTGATMGFLVEGGGKVSLNNSDTLALEVKDFAEGDRAMLFRYKVNW